MRIRRATPDDLPVVAAFSATFAAMHVAMDARRFRYPADTGTALRDFFAVEIVNPEARVLLAEESAGAVGYAFVRREPPSLLDAREATVWLHDLHVEPAHRARGVGDALLEASWAAAAELGGDELHIVVAAPNDAGRAYFATRGFRTTMLEMIAERPRA